MSGVLVFFSGILVPASLYETPARRPHLHDSAAGCRPSAVIGLGQAVVPCLASGEGRRVIGADLSARDTDRVWVPHPVPPLPPHGPRPRLAGSALLRAAGEARYGRRTW